MKKQILKSALIAMAGVGLLTGSASAVLITANYTGDNIVDTFYLQDGMEADDLAAGANRKDWTKSDTFSIDVTGGKNYSFIWQVTNDGPMSTTNPAGFLGEIDFGGAENYFSNITWKYGRLVVGETLTSNFNEDWVWNTVTTYGFNGEEGIIWTKNLGGPVAGISTKSQWIWSEKNFKTDGTGDQQLFIRADFTAVPEPGTLLLFGTGLAGLAAVARRRKTQG